MTRRADEFEATASVNDCETGDFRSVDGRRSQPESVTHDGCAAHCGPVWRAVVTLEDGDVVGYRVADGIAIVTMNRPQYRNAQNSAMTYALDSAFIRAVDDEAVRVIVLARQR